MSTATPLPRIWSLGLISVSAFFFIVACALPVFVFVEQGRETWNGLSALGIGAFGIFVGQFGWFANPILALAMLTSLFRWWIATAVIAGFGLLVALTSVMIVGQTIPLDEGNVNRATISHLHAGFYVWLLSFLVMIAGPIALRVVSSRR